MTFPSGWWLFPCIIGGLLVWAWLVRRVVLPLFGVMV